MLLLVTLALVVASAILLILGFVQDALGFIYLSMLCAGVAAVALFVFARLARRRGASLAGAGVTSAVEDERSTSEVHAASAGRSAPRPEPERRREEPRRNVAVVPAAAPSRAEGPDDSGTWWYEDEGSARQARSDLDRTQDHPVAVGSASGSAADDDDSWSAGDTGDEDWGDEVVFPIEDYDDLRVAEILPLLNQLDPDELQEVRDRELAGKARATILDRIDDRLGRAGGPPASVVTTAGIPVVDPVASGEPPAPGAPAFSPAASEAEVPTRARSSRKAATGRGAAPAAKKAQPAPKKVAARKAPVAKKASAAKEVAVLPPAGVPARAPRKAPTRQSAAAAPEPVTPAAPAKRAGMGRKVASDVTPPSVPAAGPAKKATGAAAPKKAAAAKKATRSAAPAVPSASRTAAPAGKAPSPVKRTPRKSAD